MRNRRLLAAAIAFAFYLFGLLFWIADCEVGARPRDPDRPRRYETPIGAYALGGDGGDAAEPPDGGDALPADGGDAAGPDGGDAQPADGGDAQPADGGDAQPADGGDAQPADGGDAGFPDATPDGGDAQVSPLDQNTGTLIAEWTFDIVKRDAGVSYTPLHPTAGTCAGTNCDGPEFSSPNESGQYSTAGVWTYIGTSRKDKYMFDGSSGGWGGSSRTLTGTTLTFPILVRALVQTPAAIGAQAVFWTTTAANGAVFKLLTTTTPQWSCQYDDGPGASVTAVDSTHIATSTNYVIDCYVGTDKKAVICVNGNCSSPTSAAGSTAYQPDTLGICASNANTQVWGGYAESILWYQNATWWSTGQAATDYTILTAGP